MLNSCEWWDRYCEALCYRVLWIYEAVHVFDDNSVT